MQQAGDPVAWHSLAANLGMGSFMVALTVSLHFFGLMLLLAMLRRGGRHLHTPESIAGQGAVILLAILGVFAIHTAEIWSYAVAFLSIGAIKDFEQALYFSTTTFTTLGYGDVVLAHDWRVFGAIEGANGLILFGWSTAFLISVMSRLKALEHDWLER